MTLHPKTGLVALALMGSTGVHALPIVGQGSWETTLLARDLDHDGVTDAFFDTALNVSWLADGNAADSYLTWQEAVQWAGDLTVAGIANWRLPNTTDVGNDGCSYVPGGGGADCGFRPGAESSELAHMYYVTLGNLGSSNDQGSPNDGAWGLSNTGDFVNLRQNPYWSGTVDQTNPNATWAFSNYFGFQAPYEQSFRMRAWAVHDGDVGTIGIAQPVPEPSTYALLLAGLGAVALRRRRELADDSKDAAQ